MMSWELGKRGVFCCIRLLIEGMNDKTYLETNVVRFRIRAFLAKRIGSVKLTDVYGSGSVRFTKSTKKSTLFTK